MSLTTYNRFLLFVAGLGGLLYGVDVGIIAGALPYLQATSDLSANQISFIVAAVLLGSVISTLFAGLLADAMGRRPLMIVSGLFFVASIPIIALGHGYMPLIFGRLLQGVSAGLIGVVVPLYLAECLGAANRGKGTGMFQWLLTFGICAAAIIGYCFSLRVARIEGLHNPQQLHDFKDVAWRSIFWVSLPPGILFALGSLAVAESPRWLFGRGRRDDARAALLRSRAPEEAELEMREMEAAAAEEQAKAATGTSQAKESLLQRRYIVPFILACVILACNQATGINSIIGYNANILIEAGLNDTQAHLGYVLFTIVNFVGTIGAVALVDKKGRKFLLCIGSSGIIVFLLAVGVTFRRSERLRVDCRAPLQALVSSDQSVAFTFDRAAAERLLAEEGEAGAEIAGRPTTLTVIFSYGDFRSATPVSRSDDSAPSPIHIVREDALPANRVEAFFANPFANLQAARGAPLRIENAFVTPVPPSSNGWLTALFTYGFVAFFAMGPGVCVWLALSELMPTRIRSNGMSIALLINQAVSTGIAAVFLPMVGRYGYSAMFFTFAGCTVVYFITAAFFLPETKGKTLEEIEKSF